MLSRRCSTVVLLFLHTIRTFPSNRSAHHQTSNCSHDKLHSHVVGKRDLDRVQVRCSDLVGSDLPHPVSPSPLLLSLSSSSSPHTPPLNPFLLSHHSHSQPSRTPSLSIHLCPSYFLPRISLPSFLFFALSAVLPRHPQPFISLSFLLFLPHQTPLLLHSSLLSSFFLPFPFSFISSFPPSSLSTLASSLSCVGLPCKSLLLTVLLTLRAAAAVLLLNLLHVHPHPHQQTCDWSPTATC